MCRNTGRVFTCHGKCDSESNPLWEDLKIALLKAIYSDETFYHLKVDDEEILFVLGDTWTRLDAAACLWDPIVQRDECLLCCIKYGFLAGMKQVSVITGRDCIEGMRASDVAKRIGETPTLGI